MKFIELPLWDDHPATINTKHIVSFDRFLTYEKKEHTMMYLVDGREIQIKLPYLTVMNLVIPLSLSGEKK